MRAVILGLLMLLSLGCGDNNSGSGSSAGLNNQVDQWHSAMLKQPAPEVGCYEAEYPSENWGAVACGTPRTDPMRETHGPLLRGTVRTVGNRTDWVVQVNGGLLSQVTGSFENISGVTSIVNSLTQADNDYSLQINSNRFNSPECPQSMVYCSGWQQAIYSAGGINPGYLMIQYWLLDYNNDGTTCPAGWISNRNNCYRNSSQASVAPVTTADLSEIKLTMTADAGANDHVILRIGNKLHSTSVVSPGSMLSLSQGWNQAEFNIFGNPGAETEFNTGSSMDVRLEVNKYSGGTLSCESGGTTAETNSLTLLGGCLREVPLQNPPAFTFTQSNK